MQFDRATASHALRHVADQVRAKWSKLSAFIDNSETDVLTYLDFPVQHRTKIHSTNPIERLNKAVKGVTTRFVQNRTLSHLADFSEPFTIGNEVAGFV